MNHHEAGTFRYSRAALVWIAVSIVWMAAPAGVLFLTRGGLAWAVFLLSVSVVVAVLAVDGRLLRTIEARNIPKVRGYFQAFMWPILALGIVASFYLTGDFLWPGMRPLLVIYGVGILVLVGIAVSQVVRSIRAAG